MPRMLPLVALLVGLGALGGASAPARADTFVVPSQALTGTPGYTYTMWDLQPGLATQTGPFADSGVGSGIGGGFGINDNVVYGVSGNFGPTTQTNYPFVFSPTGGSFTSGSGSVAFVPVSSPSSSFSTNQSFTVTLSPNGNTFTGFDYSQSYYGSTADPSTVTRISQGVVYGQSPQGRFLAGSVADYPVGPDRPFVFDTTGQVGTGGYTMLGQFYPYAAAALGANDNGVAVGTVGVPGGYQAVVWPTATTQYPGDTPSPKNVLVAPGTAGGTSWAASAVNDNGVIITSAFNSATEAYEFFPDGSGGYTQVPILPASLSALLSLNSPYAGVQATGINSLNDVVGTYEINGTNYGFVFFPATGQFVTIDAPPGHPFNLWGINDALDLVGTVGNSYGGHPVFLTPDFASSTVPEPGTAILAALAGVGLLAARRRRR